MKHNGKVWQTRVTKASPMWKDSKSHEEAIADGLSVLMGDLMAHIDAKDNTLNEINNQPKDKTK